VHYICKGKNKELWSCLKREENRMFEVLIEMNIEGFEFLLQLMLRKRGRGLRRDRRDFSRNYWRTNH